MLTLVAVWAVVAISLMLLSREFSAGLPLVGKIGPGEEFPDRLPVLVRGERESVLP